MITSEFRIRDDVLCTYGIVEVSRDSGNIECLHEELLQYCNGRCRTSVVVMKSLIQNGSRCTINNVRLRASSYNVGMAKKN